MDGSTEVVERTSTPTTQRWLAAVTAFLLVAAVAAVLVLYLQSREPAVEEAPLPTTAPATIEAPTPPPTEEPTPTPKETEEPRDTGPILELPGINAGRPSDPPPTTAPPTSPPPSPTL